MRDRIFSKSTFILAISILILVDCSKEPGIDSPLAFDNFKLLITSADFETDFDTGFDKIRPISSQDIFLVVVMEIKESSVESIDWEGFVTNKKGNIYDPVIKRLVSNGGKLGGITWIFSVGKNQKSLTLHFPGKISVKLDSLINC